MINSASIPAVWVHSTAASYNALRAEGYVAFLTPRQKARVERIRQARMLYRGQHRQLFLEEGRTQCHFKELEVNGMRMRPYFAVNICKLISNKGADLLFGEEPLVRVDDEIQQKKIGELAERTGLHALLIQAARECSYEAEAFFEALVWNGEVHLVRIPADTIFPIGPLMPDHQYAAYVRYRLHKGGTDHTPIWLLLEVTYTAGLITRKVWQLKDGQRDQELDIAAWNKETGETLAAETRTGLAVNTVVWVPNDLDHDEPISDYDSLVPLQDLLNAKQTQIANILLQHSDPGMVVPEEMFDDDGNLRVANKVLAARAGGVEPKYLVYPANLEAAMQDKAQVLNLLLVTAEMSPSLLGLQQGAAPDAWRKLKLEASNALSKAKRKAAIWRPAIRRLIGVAQMLEQTIPGVRYDVRPVGVEPRDGLPDDEEILANTIATHRSAGTMSRRRAVEIQIPDPAAAQRELDELAAEDRERMPSSLLGESPLPPAEQSDADDKDSSTDVSTQGGDAGIAAEATLNGEQITAVLEVLARLKAGLLTSNQAIELIVAVGLDRDRAELIVREASRTSAPPPGDIGSEAA